MATRKRITAVRLVAGAPSTGWLATQIERVLWVEDGKQFPKDEARELVTRAINAGEAFYVRTADNVDVPVKAQLRHGTYLLVTAHDAAAPDPLLALPVHATR